MKTVHTLLLLSSMFAIEASGQSGNGEKPTIIFVHGIWADGSCFTPQIELLQAKGYQVMSVQNGVTSLADDVAETQKAIGLAKGKVILVGHSWGGMVITQAGNDPKVVGLVYLAAYGPDKGESVLSVSANAPQTELSKYLIRMPHQDCRTADPAQRTSYNIYVFSNGLECILTRNNLITFFLKCRN